jgi:hypothetical protein
MARHAFAVNPPPVLFAPRGCIGALKTNGVPYMEALLFERGGARAVTLRIGPGDSMEHLDGERVAGVDELVYAASSWVNEPRQLALEIPDA